VSNIVQISNFFFERSLPIYTYTIKLDIYTYILSLEIYTVSTQIKLNVYV